MQLGRKLLLIAALALAASVSEMPGSGTCALAQSSSCRSTCLAQYNQCRIATKGAASCDTQYQACLQGCVSHR